MSQSRKRPSPVVIAAKRLIADVDQGLVPNDAEGVIEAREIVANFGLLEQENPEGMALHPEQQNLAAAIANEKSKGITYLEKERKRYVQESPKWAAYTQLISVIENSCIDRPLWAILEKDSDEMRQVVIGEKTIKGKKRRITYTLTGMPEANIQEILTFHKGKKKALSEKNLQALRDHCQIGKPPPQEQPLENDFPTLEPLYGPTQVMDDSTLERLQQKREEERLESLKNEIRENYPEKTTFKLEGKLFYVRPSERKPGELRIFQEVKVAGKGHGENAFYTMDTWKTNWGTQWNKFSTSHIRGAKKVGSQHINANLSDKKDLMQESKLGRKFIVDAQMKKVIIDPTTDTHVLPMAVKNGFRLAEVIKAQYILQTKANGFSAPDKKNNSQSEGLTLKIRNDDDESNHALDVLTSNPQSNNGPGVFDPMTMLLTPDQRVRLSIAVMRAVQEKLHKQGIVHLDLKSQNIMVDLSDPNHPIVHILDFGYSAQAGDEIVNALGTDRFIPYEILFAAHIKKSEKLGPGASPAMDVYSMGILLLDILLCPNLSDLTKKDEITYKNEPMRIYKGPAWLLYQYPQASSEQLFHYYLDHVKQCIGSAYPGEDIDKYKQYIYWIERMCSKKSSERSSLEKYIEEFDAIRLQDQMEAVQSANQIASKTRKKWNNVGAKNTDDNRDADDKFNYKQMREDIRKDLISLNITVDDPAEVIEEYLHTLGIPYLIDFFQAKQGLYEQSIKDLLNEKSIAVENVLEAILGKVDEVINEFKVIYAIAEIKGIEKIKTRYQNLIVEANKSRLNFNDIVRLNEKNKPLALPDDVARVIEENKLELQQELALPQELGLSQELEEPRVLKQEKLSDLVKANPIETIKEENHLSLANILHEVIAITHSSIIVNKAQPLLTLSQLKKEFKEKAKLNDPNVFDGARFRKDYEKELMYRAVFNLDRYLQKGNRFHSLAELALYQQKKDIMKYCKSEVREINNLLVFLSNPNTSASHKKYVEKRRAFLNLQLAMKLYLKDPTKTVPAAIAALRRIKPDCANYFINKAKGGFSLFSHSGNDYQKICSLRDPRDLYPMAAKQALKSG